MIKKMVNSLLILLAGAIIGYGLLIAAFSVSIPEERYTETRAVLDAEGYHPRESLRTGKADYFHEPVPDILDFGTDELIVDYSLRNPEQALYKHALIEEYCRYWHGYVIFWRPLFRVFDLASVRILNLEIQLFLAILLAYKLFVISQKKMLSLAWLTIYFFLGPNSTACNFQYSSIYYVTVLTALALLYMKKWLEPNNRYIYLFLISGMLTSYFDYLTYPMLTWAISAALFIAFYKAGKDDDSYIKKVIAYVVRVIVSAGVWIVGYLGFWAEKWILGQLLTDKDVFGTEVIVETSLRVGLTDSMNFMQRFNSFWVNWKHMTYLPFVLILVVWVAFWLFRYVKSGATADYKLPAYIVMFLSAPVWYFCGAEHTAGHHLYTWKVCLGSVFALLTVISLQGADLGKAEKQIRRVIARMATLLLCLALATLVYSRLKVEKNTFWNYDLEQEERMLEPGNATSFSMTFTPRYSTVTSIGPLFEAESEVGNYVILLYDGDSLLHEEKVPVINYMDTHVVEMPVNWHLEKGKAYRLVVSTAELDKPVKVWVTKQNDREEYVGNAECIQIGYTYHTPFADKSDATLYIMTWLALILSVVQAVLGILENRGIVRESEEHVGE